MQQRLRQMRFRTAVALYLSCVVLFFVPYWGMGQVLAPSCRSTVLGLTQPGAQLDPCGLQKFADYDSEFVPEVYNQIHSPRTGMLVLRNTATEFGRAAKHITGNTPANIYTWLFYQFSSDPVLILMLLTSTLTACAGLFVLFLCREWELLPLAGLGAALLTALSPFVSYWQTYPMHVATVCWSTALLWGIVRVFKHGDVIAAMTLLLGGYSLLLMGYPQAIVYVLWMLIGAVMLAAWPLLITRQYRCALRGVAILGAMALLALVLVAPVYVDVYRSYVQSARVTAPNAYFLQYILRIEYAWVILLYLAAHTVPELYGNATDVTYPFRTDGFALTVATVWIVAIALWRHSMQVWWWALSAGVLVLLSVSPLLFEALMQALPGFTLSQWTPHWNTTLPLTVLYAYGLHALLQTDARPHPRWAAALLALPLGCIGAGLIVAQWYAVAVAPWRLGVLVGQVVLLGLFVYRRQPVWVLTAIIVTVLLGSMPLQTRRAAADVQQNSPLVAALQQHVPAGARYAIVDPGLNYLLTPNINRLYGVASVHTYNNFTPPAYAQVIAALGGKTSFYGKLNTEVAPIYDTTMLWMSNVAVVLARERIDDGNLSPLGMYGPAQLMQVQQRMGPFWHTALTATPYGQDVRIVDYRQRPQYPVTNVQDQNDTITATITPQTRPTLFVHSTMAAAEWQADVYDGRQWLAARTVSVNGVFQGVVIPAGTQTARLRWVSAVQWMWVSHLAWGGIWLWYAVWLVRRYRLRSYK